MRTIQLLKKQYLLAALLLLSGVYLQAQVTVGADSIPQPFSALEIISNGDRGLRLPQMDSIQRNDLRSTSGFIAEEQGKARGLMIFNTDTKCVNTWNGAVWIERCAFTVTYKANGGTGTDIVENVGDNYTVAKNDFFTLTDMVFLRWNTAADGTGDNYYPGNPISPIADMILYAQWSTMPVGPGTPPPASTIRYVGAFWRADEIGERIIRMQVDGEYAAPWVAVVTYLDGRWNSASGDGVLLDTMMLSTGALSARGISFSSVIAHASISNAESYNLLSTGKTVISGDASAGTIIFRIGLQKTGSQSSAWNPALNPPFNTTNRPARYAIVTLFYGPNLESSMNLFLRQGEYADYLMHPNDSIRTAGMYQATRPDAARFSPYNLTAATLDAAVGINGAGSNPGIFTAYPTQAGAMFQWANIGTGADNRTRYAWNPYTPSATGWNIITPNTDYWTDAGMLVNTHETCPSGYRRPTDGITNAGVPPTSAAAANSEFRQSLWLYPQINNVSDLNNVVWGYYADGFFDRRALATSPGSPGVANSAVSSGDENVAYIGNLFYNPVTSSDRYQASLFFPVAGYRTNSNYNGTLISAGNYGVYWSSSCSSTSSGWRLTTRNGYAHMDYAMRIYAKSIRCVRP